MLSTSTMKELKGSRPCLPISGIQGECRIIILPQDHEKKREWGKRSGPWLAGRAKGKNNLGAQSVQTTHGWQTAEEGRYDIARLWPFGQASGEGDGLWDRKELLTVVA